MWMMSDVEAMAFVAIVVIMVVLAAAVAGRRGLRSPSSSAIGRTWLLRHSCLSDLRLFALYFEPRIAVIDAWARQRGDVDSRH